MTRKTDEEVEAFRKKYGLPPPTKREQLTEADSLVCQRNATKHEQVLAGEKLLVKTCQQRFGEN